MHASGLCRNQGKPVQTLQGSLHQNLYMLPPERREEGRVWWNTPVAPELRTLREKDLGFEVSLDYIARLPLLHLFFSLERSSPYVALDLGL